jgi:hypothetical protein
MPGFGSLVSPLSDAELAALQAGQPLPGQSPPQATARLPSRTGRRGLLPQLMVPPRAGILGVPVDPRDANYMVGIRG